MRLLAMLLVVAMTAMRSSGADAPSSPVRDEVQFIAASGCDSHVLGDVQVSIVMRDGTRVNVGKTASDGFITIDRARLEGAQLILFCAEDYFCTAVENNHAPAGTETLVVLSRFAIS